MVRLQDIAAAVGVTPTTVANALKGRGNVSESTRTRILQYAQEAGYHPNELARSLAQGKTFTLGFLLPTIANPFYSEIAEAIECNASEHGYQLLLCNSFHDFARGRQHLERLVNRWIDGVIVMGSSMDSADVLAQFQRGLPMVLCDWQENEVITQIPQVSVDFHMAGALAARHLIELGHKHMAIIFDEPQQKLRFDGFRSALLEVGLALPPSMIKAGDSTLESGYRAAQQLIEARAHPTAIFATTDWMALGAIEAIQAAGLRVPQDISVIGLDDIVVSAHIHPPLTTITIPKTELAFEATELLLHLIEGTPEFNSPHLIKPSLVRRQSTTIPRENLFTP